MPPALIFLILAALFFAYLTGVTDSANIVAPVISVRALSPRRATAITVVATLIAPFVFGLAVARAFGAGIVRADQATLPIVLAAALSAIVWRLLTWWLSIPSSSSHALVGGLLGAGLAGAGLAAINWLGLVKVLIALFVSPALGLLAGYLLTNLIYMASQRASPKVNVLFRRAQIVTAVALALSWGANDAQKAIGLLALALAAAHHTAFGVPWWATVAGMGALAVGTATSGWRLIRTLGGRFYKIRPVHGLAAQIAAASVIFGAAFLGGPVSTTQVVSTAIMGAGAAERVNKVRWGVAFDILWAWVFTIPVTALAGAGLFYLLNGLR